NAHIIKQPIITEKSLSLANSQNVYTFEVEPLANKHQIKEAIEAPYGVTVESVNTTVRNAQTAKTGRRRLEKSIGRSKNASIKIKDGESIELFDVYSE